MRTILFALLLASCGLKTEPVLPKVHSDKLTAAIERVEPLLAWTCDGRIPARSPGFECIKEGDGVSVLGRWILDTGDTANFSAILESVGVDGKEPRRNPARQGTAESSAFSRDQMLGLLEATHAARNNAGLLSVMRYVSRTGYLCVGDDRCRLTPSVRLLADEVLGKKPTSLERAQDEVTIQSEALSAPPTYRAYLVARKILLHAHLNTMTKSYAMSAKTLAKRFPHSAFFSVVDAVANDGDFNAVAREVTRCLEQWEGPGNAWHGDDVNGCQKRSYGHHLLAMGKFLLGLRKDTDGTLYLR